MKRFSAAGIVLLSLLLSACEGEPARTSASATGNDQRMQEYDRQMRKVAEQQAVADRQLQRGEEQLRRMDALQARWEAQADRYDAILARWEKQAVAR